MEVKTFCGSCGDSGTLTIWHPATFDSIRKGTEPPLLREAAVACTCRAGDAYTTRVRSGEHVKWLDRYGDKRWHCKRTIRDRRTDGSIFRVDLDVADFGTDALKSFVANKPQNYVDAFDQFNAGGVN